MTHVETPHLSNGERELALYMWERWFPLVDQKTYLLAIDKAGHCAGRFYAYNAICHIGGKMQHDAEMKAKG